MMCIRKKSLSNLNNTIYEFLKYIFFICDEEKYETKLAFPKNES